MLLRLAGGSFLRFFVKVGHKFLWSTVTVGLIDVSVNRGAAFVTMKGGKYYLMIDRPGRYTLNIEFLIKATREPREWPWKFCF